MAISRGTPLNPLKDIRLSALLAYFFLVCLTTAIGFSPFDRNNVKDLVVTASTNSCTVTWRSLSVIPTTILSVPHPEIWSLASAVLEEIPFDDLAQMNEQEYETAHIVRMNKAILWAECLAQNQPELGLQWCMAEYEDGKFIEESITTLGETCWRMPWRGFSLDPKITIQADIMDATKLPLVLLPLTFPGWMGHKLLVGRTLKPSKVTDMVAV